MGVGTCVDTVFLDIDIPYRFFKRRKREFEDHLNWVSERLGIGVKGYAVRESTNGNTHVFVKIDGCIDRHEELHLSTALGGSLGLFLISHRRLETLGFPYKVVFPKGMKKRKRG